MARETSVTWTCDRCAKKARMPHNENYDELPENWIRLADWQLCGKCHVELLEWMKGTKP